MNQRSIERPGRLLRSLADNGAFDVFGISTPSALVVLYSPTDCWRKAGASRRITQPSMTPPARKPTPFEPNASGLLGQRPRSPEEGHDQDLIEWLGSYGVRPPDWSIDPCMLDKVDRQNSGEENPLKLPNRSTVSGVYLFYSRTKDGIVALYVGKAANVWNRMQTHWCRPGERGWLNFYLEDVNSGALDDVVMACAWAEEERAGMEAQLIRTLKPRYCRRQE